MESKNADFQTRQNNFPPFMARVPDVNGGKDSLSSVEQIEMPPHPKDHMFTAAENGNLSEIRRMLDIYGVEILSLFDSDGMSPLHLAARNGNKEAVVFILNLGQSTDEKDIFMTMPDGRSVWKMNLNLPSQQTNFLLPIHYAITSGNLSLVQLFLSLGVDPNIRDGLGRTLLLFAVYNEKLVIVMYLMSLRVDIFATDFEGDGALHWAAYRGNINLMKIFLNLGFDVRSPDKMGQTPLHLAVLGSKMECVELLFSYNPDYFKVDSNGNTALNLAVRRNNSLIEEELKMRMKMKIPLKKRIGKNLKNWMKCGIFRAGCFFFLISTIIGSVICDTLIRFYEECPPSTLTLTVFAVSIILLIYFHIGILRANGSTLPDPAGETQGYIDLFVKTFNDKKKDQCANMRLCHTCLRAVTLGTLHCPACNKCCLDCDVHSTWFRRCIGKSESKLYLTYNLVFQFLLYVLIGRIIAVSHEIDSTPVFMRIYLYVIALITVSFQMYLFLQILSISHGIGINEMVFMMTQSRNFKILPPNFMRMMYLNWKKFLLTK